MGRPCKPVVRRQSWPWHPHDLSVCPGISLPASDESSSDHVNRAAWARSHMSPPEASSPAPLHAVLTHSDHRSTARSGLGEDEANPTQTSVFKPASGKLRNIEQCGPVADSAYHTTDHGIGEICGSNWKLFGSRCPACETPALASDTPACNTDKDRWSHAAQTWRRWRLFRGSVKPRRIHGQHNTS